MPRTIADRLNPLALCERCRPSHFSGNVLSIDGTWDDYHWGLERKFRKELERSRRVFQRDGCNARFVVATSPEQALPILAVIEQQQRTRIAALERPYTLDGPGYRAFYRALIADGLTSGFVVVSALMTGESEVVAALLGICDQGRYAMIRLSHAGRAWSHCSPGRLMIERTMQHLHGEGLRVFDFTTGDYDYKTGFGVERVRLGELSLPLSLTGRLILGRQHATDEIKRRIRGYPRLYRGLKAAWREVERK